MIGNNKCDAENKVTQCGFDEGECCDSSLIDNKICNSFNDFSTCGNHDGGDCPPFNNTNWPDCPFNEKYIGDSDCDDNLKTKPECNYDAPDCCPNHESVGEGECNPENLNDLCMNDGGDCCKEDFGQGN